MKKLILFTFASLYLFGISHYLNAQRTAVAAVTSFDVFLLTDRAASQGGVGVSLNLSTAVAGSTAHALWGEQVAADEYGLFYRAMPFGSTRRVPNTTFDEFAYLSAAGAAAGNSRACFTWEEYLDAARGDNLFLWCSDYGNKREITDNALTSGSVRDKFILMDGTNHVHVVWIEDGPGLYQQELFYYDEIGGTTRLLSRYGNPVSYIIGLDALLQGNILHVAWSEQSESGPFSPYYWDSATNTVRSIRHPDETHATGMQLLLDSDDTIHIIWGSDMSGPQRHYCPLHWDATTAVTRVLSGAQGGCLASEISATSSNDGEVHVAWRGNASSTSSDGLFYWHTAAVSSTLVTTGWDWSGYDTLGLMTGPDNNAHLMWENRSSGSYDQTDLFYWDAAAQIVKNISHPLGRRDVDTATWDVTDDGIVHIAWNEIISSSIPADVFYWDSADGVTLRLSDPAVVTGPARRPTLHVGVDDTVHLAWIEGKLGTGDPAAYYWNSSTATLTERFELGASAQLSWRWALWFDGADDLAAYWTVDSGGAEFTDLFTWSQDGGVVNVSEAAGTGGDIDDDVHRLQDDHGRSALVWAEFSGTAEGYDFYCAAQLPDLYEAVYLPVIVHP